MTESESAILLGWNAHKIRAGGGVQIKIDLWIDLFLSVSSVIALKSKISGNIIEKYAILRKREHGNHLSVRK